MTSKAARIRALITAITAHLERRRAGSEGAEAVLARLAETDLSPQAFTNQPPRSSRHDATLTQAIEGVTAPELADMKAALIAARDDLVWAEDEIKYYAADADLGEGYRRCNLHTLLIGPGACGFEHADFTLGLFMLGPRTLYRDHAHPAPETYINLSPTTGWRFGGGPWEDRPAGSILYNPPHAVHATRVYDQPFLSVFSWIRDIDQPCQLIAKDDWPAIEAALAQL